MSHDELDFAGFFVCQIQKKGFYSVIVLIVEDEDFRAREIGPIVFRNNAFVAEELFRSFDDRDQCADRERGGQGN